MSALSFVTRGEGWEHEPLKFMINPWKFWGSFMEENACSLGWVG